MRKRDTRGLLRDDTEILSGTEIVCFACALLTVFEIQDLVGSEGVSHRKRDWDSFFLDILFSERCLMLHLRKAMVEVWFSFELRM